MTADSLAVIKERKRLRNVLVAALNGATVSGKDGWAILDEWDALVERLEQAEARLEFVLNEAQRRGISLDVLLASIPKEETVLNGTGESVAD